MNHTAGQLRLADLTTLRLGGPADAVEWARTETELVRIVRELDRAGAPVLLVGGGSNLVVADAGFPGTVVLIRTRGVTVARPEPGALTLTVAAGEPWDDVVAQTVDEGFGELAALSGIPGLAGAAPVQNVGAYGAELSTVVGSVRTLDRDTGRVTELAADGCGFGYRDSAFKRSGRHVILAVTVHLHADRPCPVRYPELAATLGVRVGTVAPPAAVREAVLGLRRSKAMVIDPPGHTAADPDTVSAGSFFTNPVLPPEQAALLPSEAPRYPASDGRVKISAAWMIERAGFSRGYGHGPARISTRHALALTNRGGASTTELLQLAAEIVAGVRDRFGVTLEPEPVLVGCTLT